MASYISSNRGFRWANRNFFVKSLRVFIEDHYSYWFLLAYANLGCCACTSLELLLLFRQSTSVVVFADAQNLELSLKFFNFAQQRLFLNIFSLGISNLDEFRLQTGQFFAHGGEFVF